MIRAAAVTIALSSIACGRGAASSEPERPRSSPGEDLLPRCWLRTDGSIATGAEGAKPRRPPVRRDEIGPPDEQFRGVRGWQGVEIGAPLDEGERALERAGIAFERERMHKSGEPYLSARWREFDVTVYTGARPSRGARVPRIKEVLLRGPQARSLHAAEDVLDEIERELGTPQLGCHHSIGGADREDWAYRWTNRRVEMEVTLSGAPGGTWRIWWSFTAPES